MSNIKTIRSVEKILIASSALKERDLDKWMVLNKVSFTDYGDVIPFAVYSLGNPHEIKMYINGIPGKQLIALTMEAMTGIVIFKNLLFERIFWDCVQRRLRDEYSVSIPKKSLPSGIFNLSEKDTELLKGYN